MLYRDDNVIGDLLPEIDLVYTFQCPVTVAPSTNGQDDKSVDAAVLQAKKTENRQVVYTVMYGVMGGILLTDKELKQAELSIDIAHPTKTFRTMASENLRCLHLKIMISAGANGESNKPPVSEVTFEPVAEDSLDDGSRMTLPNRAPKMQVLHQKVQEAKSARMNIATW
ncbi:LOW QUALITY PROTEIN: hypothetical protein ACHAWO_013047 [Cyclotella atomus]|uniref:Uncharacterized protein n=1 Tax=Cyclotella atomus TaxID=382360 RepID=A0ABD3NPY6_9STRA